MGLGSICLVQGCVQWQHSDLCYAEAIDLCYAEAIEWKLN